MKLEKLTITNYKNLRNFTIDFGIESQIMVFVGQNGAGKSNLLEALVLIFRDLDLGQPPSFKYRIEYVCREAHIHIDADPQRIKSLQLQITVDGQSVTYKNFYRAKEPRYLPEYVLGYYSGLNESMPALFEKHYERFYGDIVRGLTVPRLSMIYAEAAYRQFALLSFFVEPDQRSLNFLQHHLRIQELDSVLFVIAEPPWKHGEGDPRFWGAKGAVQRALDYLYAVAEEPLRRKTRIRLDYRTVVRRECLYLLLHNQRRLQHFYNFYGSLQEFFQALASIEMSGMLYEVRVNVKVRNADGTIVSRSLSEGEQQLLMVLGLLRFTRNEETLFLLDEPDTHLNPAWSIQYLDLIERLVGPHGSSQLLMSTHNPLVISSLKKSEVCIMQRDPVTNNVYADTPFEDPRGMGVAAILTSDMFGLRSTLDQPTQYLIDQRRELALKADVTGEELSQENRQQLSELNQQLKDLDFSITTQDPLYHDYVLEMTKREDATIRQSITLTDEQRKRQRDLTRRVIKDLKEKRSNQG